MKKLLCFRKRYDLKKVVLSNVSWYLIIIACKNGSWLYTKYIFSKYVYSQTCPCGHLY